MSSIAEQAQEIVKDNGMEDKITVIRGKVEDIKLPVDKVRYYCCYKYISYKLVFACESHGI